VTYIQPASYSQR